MIIQQSLPTGYTIFCDDFRREDNGKALIIGVYDQEMLVTGSLPIALPQLYAVVHYRLDPETVPQEIDVQMILDHDGSEQLLAQIIHSLPALPPAPPQPVGDENAQYFAELIVPLRANAFMINGHCRVKSRVFIGDDEVRLGSLTITPIESQEAVKEPASV